MSRYITSTLGTTILLCLLLGCGSDHENRIQEITRVSITELPGSLNSVLPIKSEHEFLVAYHEWNESTGFECYRDFVPSFREFNLGRVVSTEGHVDVRAVVHFTLQNGTIDTLLVSYMGDALYKGKVYDLPKDSKKIVISEF